MSTSSILSDSDADMDSCSDSDTPYDLVFASSCSEPGSDCGEDESSDLESIDGFDGSDPDDSDSEPDAPDPDTGPVEALIQFLITLLMLRTLTARHFCSIMWYIWKAGGCRM